jgi:hypothetical protein
MRLRVIDLDARFDQAAGLEYLLVEQLVGSKGQAQPTQQLRDGNEGRLR